MSLRPTSVDDDILATAVAARRARVVELRQAIEEGRYPVDVHGVARATRIAAPAVEAPIEGLVDGAAGAGAEEGGRGR